MHLQSTSHHSSKYGFSLVEIALAIGILALAFVPLFGLLPVGLTSFRQSIDSSNATWITQSLSSMIQTTEWERISGPEAKLTKDIFYYDEEGRPTDTASDPSSDPKVKESRHYEVKLFVLPQTRPMGDGQTEPIALEAAQGATASPLTVRVIAVMAIMRNQGSHTRFEGIETAEQASASVADDSLIVRSFVASRMGLSL